MRVKTFDLLLAGAVLGIAGFMIGPSFLQNTKAVLAVAGVVVVGGYVYFNSDRDLPVLSTQLGASDYEEAFREVQNHLDGVPGVQRINESSVRYEDMMTDEDTGHDIYAVIGEYDVPGERKSRRLRIMWDLDETDPVKKRKRLDTQVSNDRVDPFFKKSRNMDHRISEPRGRKEPSDEFIRLEHGRTPERSEDS